MQEKITGRQIDITDSMREYIEKTVQGLKKYSLNIQELHTIVKNEKNGIQVEMIISIPGQEKFAFHSSDKDFFVATSKTYESAEKKLRRHHDKVISKRKRK